MSKLFDSPEITLASTAIVLGEPYAGIRYRWLQLSGRSIAKLTDVQVQGVLLPQVVTTYWPGGAEGIPKGAVATVDYLKSEDDIPDGALGEEDMAVRFHYRMVKGMDIANTTLTKGRYKSGPEARWMEDPDVLRLAYEQSAPLGAVAISQVVDHNQLDEVEHVAGLYVPDSTLFPLYVFRAIRGEILSGY